MKPSDQDGSIPVGDEQDTSLPRWKWRKIGDFQVRHVWKCTCRRRNFVRVGPGFYEEAGTPVCSDCGRDMSYVKTEMFGI